jgi:hypothetical protein
MRLYIVLLYLLILGYSVLSVTSIQLKTTDRVK